MAGDASRRRQENLNWYLSLVVIALLIIVPPVMCSLLYLSQVPDVVWGDTASPSFTRIWMYRERRPVGIAYQSRRIVEEYSPTEVCVETRLRFFLWGDSPTADPAVSKEIMAFIDNLWQRTEASCR